MKIKQHSTIAKNIVLLSNLFVAFSALEGCATVFSGTDQPMQVTAKNNNGQDLNNVICTVQADNGNLQLTSPGTTIVERGSKPINISCNSQDNQYVGTATVQSHYNSTNLWNIGLTIPYIIPGAIGWTVDGITGADLEYPHAVVVKMHTTQSSN